MPGHFVGQDNRLRTGWRIMVAAVLLILALVAIDLIWKSMGLPGRRDGGAWFFLLRAVLVSMAALVSIASLLKWFEGVGLAAIGLPGELTAWRPMLLGTGLGAVPVVLVVVVATVGGYGSVSVRASSVWALLPAVATWFFLALWEELALRGYLFRQLCIGLNPTAAILITGLLFGALHGANRGSNWQGLLLTAVGGILMGLLFYRTRSLWLLVGYHFGWNAVSSSFFGLQLSGAEEQASMFDTVLTGSDWMTGGSYGFEAALPTAFLEILVLAVVLWGWSRAKAVVN